METSDIQRTFCSYHYMIISVKVWKISCHMMSLHDGESKQYWSFSIVILRNQCGRIWLFCFEFLIYKNKMCLFYKLDRDSVPSLSISLPSHYLSHYTAKRETSLHRQSSQIWLHLTIIFMIDQSSNYFLSFSLIHVNIR